MIFLTALVSVLLTLPACVPEDAARGTVVIRDEKMQGLLSGALVSVRGTYGSGCTGRSGAWSVVVAADAMPDPPSLSVLMNDATCALTLTELRTSSGVLAAQPVIPLGSSYAPTPSAFGSPVAFYANAQLSAVGFADNFVLTVRYTDDPRIGARTNTARAIPPTVIAVTPPAGSLNRSIATKPTARFDAPMNAASITDSTFTLTQANVAVPGTVAFDAVGNTATFFPNAVLGLDLTYVATLTVGAEDIGNTPLAAPYVWSFRTATSSQAPVALGAAEPFVVLSASSITNVGATMLTGDLGSGAMMVSGFPPGGFVSGIQQSGPVTSAARAALDAAYADAAGRSLNPISVDSDLGGQTLWPGLYRAPSSLEVNSADLTLDALGDGDAVFVFQIGTTWTMNSGRKVVLLNGAKASNIYWQVGSSATLGTGSQLSGTLMAEVAVTLTSGATVSGRVMTRSAAITLDTNTIVRPLP